MPFGFQGPGPGQPGIPQGGGLADVLGQNLGNADQFQQYNQNREAEPRIDISTRTDPDTGQPLIKVDNITPKLMGLIQQAMSFHAQGMAGMQQRVDQLAAQEQRARQHPILNVLSQVAGQLAVGDKRLPPLVAALGRSSLALNPTPDQLGQQRLGLQQEIGKMGEQGARLEEGILQHRALAQSRDDALAERKRSALERESETKKRDQGVIDEKAAAREDTRFRTALTHFDTDLKNTKGREVSRDAFEAGMKAYGTTDKEKIAAGYESYRSQAASYRAAQSEKAKEDAFRRQNSPAFMKQKEDADNAKALAEHILKMKGKPGFADSLKQVTGAFGGFKAKVMANLVRMDPTFSEAQAERVVKTEDDFSSATGKAGQQLISFGTFSRHAGELADVYKDLAKDSTTAPFLNKSWQWILKNSGDPRVARVATALAPVKKEYESFLLGNRALYQLDRKEADELQNPTQSPKQFMESLNQMGKTVEARYGELGKQYQNVTGTPLQQSHPLSQEAVDGLKKIGVNIPQPQTAWNYDPTTGTFK